MQVEMSNSALTEALRRTCKTRWSRQKLARKYGDTATDKIQITFDLDEDEIPEEYDESDLDELSERMSIILFDELELVNTRD